jgi:hypothetical protein
MPDPDLTIRELQSRLPWTVRYSADYRANPQSHKDYAHAVTHAQKALGKLAELVDECDHDKSMGDTPFLREGWERFIADLVICAMRAANTFPGGVVDLQRAVVRRLETKNGVSLVAKSDAADREASKQHPAHRIVDRTWNNWKSDVSVQARANLDAIGPAVIMPAPGQAVMSPADARAELFAEAEKDALAELFAEVEKDALKEDRSALANAIKEDLSALANDHRRTS